MSATEIGEIYGYSHQAVGLWATRDGCPRNRDKTFDLAAVIRWREARIEEQVGSGDLASLERKRHAEAEMAEHKLAILKADYIPREEVEQRSVAKIQAVTRALDLIPVQLPPLLVGRTAREIQGELKDAVLQIRRGFGRGVEMPTNGKKK